MAAGHSRGDVMDWLSRDEPAYVPAVDIGSVRYLGTGPNGGPLVSFRSTERVGQAFDDREIEFALRDNCEWWADDGVVGRPVTVKDRGAFSSWDGGYHVRETKAYRAELFRYDDEE